MKAATSRCTAAAPAGSWKTYQSTSGREHTLDPPAALVASSQRAAASRGTHVRCLSRPAASPTTARTGTPSRPPDGAYVSSSARSAWITGTYIFVRPASRRMKSVPPLSASIALKASSSSLCSSPLRPGQEGPSALTAHSSAGPSPGAAALMASAVSKARRAPWERPTKAKGLPPRSAGPSAAASAATSSRVEVCSASFWRIPRPGSSTSYTSDASIAADQFGRIRLCAEPCPPRLPVQLNTTTRCVAAGFFPRQRSQGVEPVGASPRV
mmetsp:Transcript_29193/g.91405  ORF Transcript_29193/g.91405 Transcript_29193/m.91405 type:complete len:269 (+) Transcript_29193:164-970(+)